MTNLNIKHNNVDKTNGFVAMFGNQIYGETPNENQTLQSFWRKQLERSKTRSGDVTLYHNGKIIRYVWNMENRLLDKNVKFPCTYNKN